MAALRIACSLALALGAFAGASVAASAADGEAAPAHFEQPSALPHAAFGPLQLDRDPLSRSAREPRKAPMALELPLGATWKASAGSLARPSDRVRPVFRERDVEARLVPGLVGVALQF